MTTEQVLNFPTGVYLCNPYKNIKCSKNGCALGPNGLYPQCFCTNDPTFALQDGEGNPICHDLKIGDRNAEIIGILAAAEAIASERIMRMKENLGYSELFGDDESYTARRLLEEAEGFYGLITRTKRAIVERLKGKI